MKALFEMLFSYMFTKNQQLHVLSGFVQMNNRNNSNEVELILGFFSNYSKKMPKS